MAGKEIILYDPNGGTSFDRARILQYCQERQLPEKKITTKEGSVESLLVSAQASPDTLALVIILTSKNSTPYNEIIEDMRTQAAEQLQAHNIPFIAVGEGSVFTPQVVELLAR